MGSIQLRTEMYKKYIAGTDIFDVALWWAPQNQDAFVIYQDFEIQIQDWYAAGIKGGIVTHQSAKENDPFIGNEEIIELVRNKENIYACIVLVPEMFFDEGKGGRYLARMKAEGAVAARIFPGNYMHSTREYVLGPMLRVLEKASMPLIVWHIDTGWDAIDRICTDHPKLNVIVESMDRKLLYHARDYMSLMRSHDNFYLETHNLVLFREYENLCKYVGSKHLLYGSYFPYANIDFSLYPIYDSEIDDSDRKAIYSENARRIFTL